MRHHNALLESTQTIGKVERHGSILKAILRKTVQESQPSNIEEMATVLSECIAKKSELWRHPGFNPSQHVLGKQPRVSSSITDEAASFGTYQVRNETSLFYLRHKARLEARKAFVHLETQGCRGAAAKRCPYRCRIQRWWFGYLSAGGPLSAALDVRPKMLTGSCMKTSLF